jgi:hypothetical protein
LFGEREPVLKVPFVDFLRGDPPFESVVFVGSVESFLDLVSRGVSVGVGFFFTAAGDEAVADVAGDDFFLDPKKLRMSIISVLFTLLQSIKKQKWKWFNTLRLNKYQFHTLIIFMTDHCK